MPEWVKADDAGALVKALGALPPGTVTRTPDQINALTGPTAPGVGAVANLDRDPTLGTVPFSPGQPLYPALVNIPTRPSGLPDPRRFEVPSAWNLQVTEQKPVPFATLRSVADTCDLERRCIEAVKALILGMEWDITVSDEAVARTVGGDTDTGTAKHLAAKKDLRDRLQPEIDRVHQFWERPDPINGMPWADWLSVLLEEVLVIDALSIYPVTGLDAQVKALTILDGSTIRPLLDDNGNRPQAPQPAFQQVLYGFPRDEFTAVTDSVADFTAEALFYSPRSKRSYSPYGFSPVERSLTQAALWMNRQAWLRAEFTDGVIPDMLIESDAMYGNNPELLLGYEAVFNDSLAGQTELRRRAKLLPAGMKAIINANPGKFDTMLDDQIVKDMTGHYGILPSQIGYTPRSGLGGAGHQQGEQNSTEVYGVKPLVRWLVDVLNELSRRALGMSRDLTFVLSDGTTDDADKQATRRQTEVFSGQSTLNEARADAGKTLYEFPEADIPFVVAGATVVPVAGLLDAQAAADAPDTTQPPRGPGAEAPAPTVPAAPAAPAPTHPSGAGAPVAPAKAVELRTFAEAVRKGRTRPFRFDHVPDQEATLLNGLLAADPRAARDYAQALARKAGDAGARADAPVAPRGGADGRPDRRVRAQGPVGFAWSRAG